MNRTHGVTAAILRDIDRFGRQPAIQLRLGNGRPPIREQRFDLLLHAIDRGAKRFLGFGISLAKGLELLGQRTVFSKKEGLGIFPGLPNQQPEKTPIPLLQRDARVRSSPVTGLASLPTKTRLLRQGGFYRGDDGGKGSLIHHCQIGKHLAIQLDVGLL